MSERQSGRPSDTARDSDPPAGAGRHPSAIELETVYEALRSIARRERGRNPSRTLNTTVLVHEAWLKLGGDRAWNDTRQCLGTYAMAIRQVLVDYIRNRTAAKRTPDPDFEHFHLEQLGTRTAEELLEIDRALDRLESLDPRLARLVELRFFAGLSVPEAAASLGVSERTATRDWQRARAFLQAVRDDGRPGHGAD
ncbi:ECF-type sigma factor [Halomonas denitrificans]|nr:sigma-70 family RNA polymerase sigma factor [Halomonas denitrificans]